MVAIYQIGFLAVRIPGFAPWAIPRYNGWLILPSALRSSTKCQKPSFWCRDTILMPSVVDQSKEILWIPSHLINITMKLKKYMNVQICETRVGTVQLPALCREYLLPTMNARNGWMIGIIIGYSVTNRWVCRLGVCISARHAGRDCPVRSTAQQCPSSCPPAHHNRHLKTVPFYIFELNISFYIS